MTSSVLITGANRGIGLEFTRVYAQEGRQVIACCRHPEQAGQLQQLGKQYPALAIQRLDITESASIDALASHLGSRGIDLLINNAGIYGPNSGRLQAQDPQAWLEVLNTNCIAPMQLTQSLLPHLGRAKTAKIAFLSSKMGSMGDNSSGGAYIYRSSKAALNAVVKSLAIDLAPQGIAVAALHPGWVKTDMGGPHGLISAAESVQGMIRVIERLSVNNTGRFYDYAGNEIPW